MGVTKPKIMLFCLNPECGKEFEVVPWNSGITQPLRKRKYCGKSCAAKVNNKIRYAQEPGDWTNFVNRHRDSWPLGTVCRICDEEEFSRSPKRHHVDHCHKTGKIRGLLCQSCNLKLGWVERHREKIISYLDEGEDFGGRFRESTCS